MASAGLPSRRGDTEAEEIRGSDRQVRGLVLAELRASDIPVTRAELDAVWADEMQLERSINSLLADGLVVRREGAFELPG
jgi:A/G-specific adenine glycosylase